MSVASRWLGISMRRPFPSYIIHIPAILPEPNISIAIEMCQSKTLLYIELLCFHFFVSFFLLSHKTLVMVILIKVIHEVVRF